MKLNKKRLGQFLVIMVSVVVLSSCNRGTGCPTSFDIQPIFSILGF